MRCRSDHPTSYAIFHSHWAHGAAVTTRRRCPGSSTVADGTGGVPGEGVVATASFGSVSRPAVRESAPQQLSAGLVEVRQGDVTVRERRHAGLVPRWPLQR